MEIKIYTADVGPLSDERLFRALYERVSAGRREKTDRMRFEKDKRLTLGAGALLETALAAEGVDDFTMAEEQNHKPCLAGRPALKFNLSHSGTKVLCALSDCDIGCDVEAVREIDMKIARRFFFAGEYEALLRCPPGERGELFFRFWTCKESFMKATGLGLALPLGDFCVLLEGDAPRVRQQVDGRSYYFKEFDRGDAYRYAVCSAGKPLGDTGMTEVFFER